jgi:phosphopantothenoylcysteine synthetase/decarboxylase
MKAVAWRSVDATQLLTTVKLELAYLVVTGTTTAPLAVELVRGLLQLVPRVITIATPNAGRVIAPRDLSAIPGNQLVESYFDAAILPRPPDGLVVVAPCSFNSLNKLAAGISDNLAMSLTAEAIGRRTPVIVAVSVNAPLLRHPRCQTSMATLREWGVSVIEPVDSGDGPRLAPTEAILAEAQRRLLNFN